MDTDKFTQSSPWHPETDIINLAAIGKLQEELGELQAILGRCLIQGIDESDPDTGESNRKILMDEIADVFAGIEMNINIFSLHVGTIRARMHKKIHHLQGWHKLLRDNK